MPERAHDEEATTVELGHSRPIADGTIESGNDTAGVAPRLLSVQRRQRALRPIRGNTAIEPGNATLVVGVFASSEQAEAVVDGLRRIGQTSEDVEVRTPASGRYQLENRMPREIAQAVIVGIAIGGPVGVLIGLELLRAAVPAIVAAAVSDTLLSVLIGGFWGAFYGAVGGLALEVLTRAEEEYWWETSAGSGEIVVVARAGARASATRDVMRRLGVLHFLAEIPAAHPADAAARAA